jgi:2-polyprenyl-3-methyl-5-hydroxy-6-metoxy-1,4-benzoquinol methylase
MEKNEYTRMYNLESNFWWYRTLHELVDYTVGKNKHEGNIKILDAGCGTGRMMEILQKYGLVLGIDNSEEAVGYVKKRGLNNIVWGNLNDYCFENESYDTITCLDVLYHSDVENDSAIVKKFYDALKKDGILILNLPAFECLRRPHDITVHTKKRYRKREFVNELKESGFSVKSSSYRMPHLFFIILMTKLFSGKQQPEKSESDLKELPSWMNSILLYLGRIENGLLKRGFSIPVGSSLFVIAQK